MDFKQQRALIVPDVTVAQMEKIFEREKVKSVYEEAKKNAGIGELIKTQAESQNITDLNKISCERALKTVLVNQAIVYLINDEVKNFDDAIIRAIHEFNFGQVVELLEIVLN